MKKWLLASVLFLVSFNGHAANIVINGSFENPDIAPGTWNVYSPAILGWTTGGAGIEIRDNVAGKAYEGSQFAELDAHGRDSNSSISQTLDTIVGQMYQLSFAYSPRIRQPEATNGISVFWNGTLLDTVSGVGSNIHDWMVYSFMVEAVGNDVLKFAAVGKQDTLGGSLDAVKVSAIPLPAALFLLAPALIGLLGLRRKAESRGNK